MKREPLKIFIASSGRASLLAESLQSQLESAASRANMSLSVVAWFRDGAFPPGEDTLTSLFAHCGGSANVRPSDFCAVLLTKDDELTKKDDKSQAPRDNCIFELGLFIGALGLDPKRCFMISSVGEQSLPSDLKGRTLIKFVEPDDLHDPQQCASAMEAAAVLIRNRIQSCGKYAAPELKPTSLDDLMASETPLNNGGGLSEASEVVVGIEHSFTAECRWAWQVVENLKASIVYTYFVSNLEPSSDIARLIHALAVGSSRGKEATGERDDDLILQNLELLRNGLRINLSPGQVSCAFRIHNALVLDEAICYLRQPSSGKYFEWSRDRDALEFARGLQSITFHNDDLDPIYVIRPTRFFDFQSPQNAPYLQRIRRAVSGAFRPEFRQHVERVCFGTEPKSQVATVP